MKLRVICVGKTRQDWTRSAVDEYAARIKRYLPFELVEVREEKGAESEPARQAECLRIEKQIPKGSRLIILDERGTEMNSEEFAGMIGRYRDGGIAELAFAVGGAYGFTQDFLKRADKKVSLSRMTFTHQMVRIFLLEQIYRGFTILNGEPYHH